MRTVNIADLKNNLSAHLERVRAGEELLVKDRNLPSPGSCPSRRAKT
jgi:antitoxin (DNA-binding transcriptional repressor) of toxin-antitoxin stability system